MDVQRGRVVEGRWLPHLIEHPELYGVERMGQDGPPTDTHRWGAHLVESSSTTLVELRGPTVEYTVPVEEHIAEPARQLGRVLVMLSQTVRTETLSARGPVALWEGVATGEVVGVWAKLGAAPVPLVLPDTPIRPEYDISDQGGVRVRSSDELGPLVDDVTVEARATWVDHPAVDLLGVLSTRAGRRRAGAGAATGATRGHRDARPVHRGQPGDAG